MVSGGLSVSKHESTGKWVGRPLPRLEDARHVQGQGVFDDDYKLEGMLYLQLVRSPYADARIARVDVFIAASVRVDFSTLPATLLPAFALYLLEGGHGAGYYIVNYGLTIN